MKDETFNYFMIGMPLVAGLLAFFVGAFKEEVWSCILGLFVLGIYLHILIDQNHESLLKEIKNAKKKSSSKKKKTLKYKISKISKKKEDETTEYFNK